MGLEFWTMHLHSTHIRMHTRTHAYTHAATRRLTAIYYMNPEWLLERDGGALRLYLDSTHAHAPAPASTQDPDPNDDPNADSAAYWDVTPSLDRSR